MTLRNRRPRLGRLVFTSMFAASLLKNLANIFDLYKLYYTYYYVNYMFGILSSYNFHKYTEPGVDCPTCLTLVTTMMCVIVGYTGYLYVIN